MYHHRADTWSLGINLMHITFIDIELSTSYGLIGSLVDWLK